MFVAFFPQPRLFLLTALGWIGFAIALWYGAGTEIGLALGFDLPLTEVELPLGLGYFVTPEFLWFYVYFLVFLALFAGAWFVLSPHPYQWWSILGTAAILFSTYFSVQVSVAINYWRRPFFDSVQTALSGSNTTVGVADLFGLLGIFSQIAFVWVAVYVVTRYFVSHYVFRWRQAMNDYYMARWREVRQIEGASQRVQEDTMRFATIMEDLGVKMVDSVMTLFAFLPLLSSLSESVTELPLVGVIPEPLVTAAIAWSLFGTVLLAVAGIKLPGLNFRNQRVEAAYRKELVYGEDNPARADRATTRELFRDVRRNYFVMYFHYAYFNVFRGFYVQADNIFVFLIMIPTIIAGKVSFGLLQQILSAFNQVSTSFQFLVESWTTIIELLSIHKRLMAFERAFEGLPLPREEQVAND